MMSSKVPVYNLVAILYFQAVRESVVEIPQDYLFLAAPRLVLRCMDAQSLNT